MIRIRVTLFSNNCPVSLLQSQSTVFVVSTAPPLATGVAAKTRTPTTRKEKPGTTGMSCKVYLTKILQIRRTKHGNMKHRRPN